MRLKYSSFHKIHYCPCTHRSFFQEEVSSEGFHKADDAVLATRRSVRCFCVYDFLSQGSYCIEYAPFLNVSVEAPPLH
jgi:hypothetical protein